MKRTLKLCLLATMVALLGLVPAYAQSQTMTDAHIAHIKQNCPLALATLGRIHANDAPQYINSNQVYFSVGDKLMARLNSRLTLNQFDASALVKTVSDYNEALKDFRSAYKTYDDTMAELVRTDCQRVPVTFYDRVALAREQRTKVHEAAVGLQELIVKYRAQVIDFKSENLKEKADGSE